MKTASLYVRVSTDEQAIRGYSQGSQQDRLTKYCLAHDIDILQTVFEDHSAKTFDRPAWSAMLVSFKRNKWLRPNLLLFTKWDRFSRNAGDAYYMISQLQHLGIQPQAIDQELDLSVPENKIILGVYLATSESENDRRSLNVRQGIHKALQEGRWTAHVPMGYKSKMDADQKRALYSSEPEAGFIRKAFALTAQGQHNVETIYQQLIASGFKCSISHFRRILRNPFYCGKIPVPAFEQEPAHLINGLHEPLITETLFERVQGVLDGRSPKQCPHCNTEEALLLRGFLHCPRCSKLLTGSASRGKLGHRYYYYHCGSSCGFRIRADKTNQLFHQRLDELQIDEAFLDVYSDILKHTRKDLYAEKMVTRNTIVATIDRLIERIVRAKELLIKGEIDDDDFSVIKENCEQNIHTLGSSMQQAEWVEQRQSESLKRMTQRLAEMEKTFADFSLIDKRQLISLLLKENLVMDAALRVDDIISPAIKLLFGLHADPHNCKKRRQDYLLLGDCDEAFAHRMLTRIASIATIDKGSIDKRTAQQILSFLSVFARIDTQSCSYFFRTIR